MNEQIIFKNINEKDIEYIAREYETEIRLEYLYVIPTLRNQGLGTKFMQEIIEYANKKQKIIILHPAPEFDINKNKLLDFYKELGFKFFKSEMKKLYPQHQLFKKPNKIKK